MRLSTNAIQLTSKNTTMPQKLRNLLSGLWFPLVMLGIVAINLWDIENLGEDYERRFQYNEQQARAQAVAASRTRGEQIDTLSTQLEEIWAELRSLRPLGARQPTLGEIASLSGEKDAVAVAGRIVSNVDALGDLEAQLSAQFELEAAELNSARMLPEILSRLDTQKTETLNRARAFKALIAPLRSASLSRSSGQAASALSDLLTWQAGQATARGFQSRGDADLATQFFKTQVRSSPNNNFVVTPDNAKVDLAAKSFQNPPTSADLAETVEVKFTPAITALAQQLGTPIAIFKHVYNTVEYVPTWGSTQTAEMTLRNGRGSSADIASLTLALLRKAGVPARYAHGLVEVPIERLQNWLDVKSPTLALELLQSTGAPAVGLTAGGRLIAVRMEHIWVEAYVDFIPSRAENNRVPDQWVPVDVAFKQYTALPSLPLLADTTQARLDATRALVQSAQVGAVGRVNRIDLDTLNASTQTLTRQKIESYLAADPNLQGDKLYARRVVQRDDTSFLSGSLALALRSSVIQRYSELPDSLRHKLRIQFYANATAVNTDSPTESILVPLARIGTNSVTLDYDPATAADAQLLNSYAANNASVLNPSLVNVRTRFKAGSDTLIDAGVVRMGSTQYFRAEILFPNGFSGDIEPYRVIAGSPTVLAFDQVGITLERAQKEGAALPEGPALYEVKQTLYLGGLLYWTMHNFTDDQLARSLGGRAQRLPSVGAFSMPYQVRYFFGVARTGFQIGRSTDVKAARSALSVSTGPDFAPLALKIGAFGSAVEGANWAMLNGSGNQGFGLTTTSLLRLAIEEGQPIYQIQQSNLNAALAEMDISPDSEQEIRQSVGQGLIVIAPQRDVSFRNWKGIGYVIFDPRNGNSLQRVEGGLAGGIEWGCIAVAISLKLLCDSKILSKVLVILTAIGSRLIARLGVAPILAAVLPGVGVVLGIISAVELAIAVMQAVAEVTRWVRSIMDGIEVLTSDEMALLGVKAINEIACNYSPPCMPFLSPAALGFGGGGGAGGGDSRGSDGPAAGNPVMIGSGSKWQYDQDYLAEGPFPLTFVRTYNSQAPRTASFMGARWTATYFQSLRTAPNFDGSREELPNSIMITRPEGGWYQFDRQLNNSYLTKANLPGALERLTSGGRLSGWRYRTQLDTVEEFDADGKLISIRDRAGLAHTVSYDTRKRPNIVTDSYGRTLKFSYAGNGYLQTMIDPSNRITRYSHNDDGNLTRIEFPDGRHIQYHYEDLSNRFALTGKTDERGVRVTNYSYSDNGKVKEYKRAGDVDRYQFSYQGNQTTVVDPLGTSRTYAYKVIHDRPYLTEVTQPCSACSSDASAKTYDGRGLIETETDFKGNITRYERDSRALVTKLTAAQGTPVQRVTTARYESQWHLPNRVEEPITGGVRVREFTYDSEGNATQAKVTVGLEVRTTTMTYNANGQKLTEDGPRADVQDIQTWVYDAQGNVATYTNAVGHITTYNSYNADGQVTQMTDANGLITEYRYDDRMRLAQQTQKANAADAGELTTYAYTPFGELDKVTLADGSFLSYFYDGAQRLTNVTDSLGHERVYTLNNNGDVVKEDTKDPNGTLAQTMSRVIDNLGRVQKTVGASANEVTEYSYDGNGNEKTALDPNQNLTSSEYDALDRIIQTTDPDLKAVNFKYDPQDNLTEVSDPRTLKTIYGYSGFDELTKLTSPDTGVTDYTYDASGNLSTRKDARNVTAIYTYDRANRVSTISYPAITGANAQLAETLTFVYDEATGGAGAKGRLTTATDGTATTKYQYDRHGRVTSKAQAVGSITKTQTMSYKPNGQLDEHTLPSGAVIKYSYRADGRVVTISVNGVAITREIEYFAFGEPKSWKLGASGNDQYLRTFDTNGRVKEHTAGPATRAIGFDPASRITSISDGAAGPSWTYGYDKLDRLKTADSSALKLEWGFDATGNRLSEKRAVGVAAPITTAYAIDLVSNKLSSVGTTNRTYDSVGNTTLVGADSSVYSARNRLVQVNRNGTLANYGYNAFGERVSKTVSGSSKQFVYDEDGHVLGEYDAAGALTSEYVWLGDVPVAVIKPNVSTQGGIAAGTSKVYLIQPDHLDTPRVIVNAANQVVWRWDSAPFGDTNANEQPTASIASFRFDLRFPGQQFDFETGSHYNYSRDYESATGRYLQSDPIGLVGGVNLYNYVELNPLGFADEFGEAISKDTRGKVLAENVTFFKCATCECCGMDLIPSKKSRKDVTPPQNEIQFDHIKAKSNGGGDEESNVQILARVCNRRDSNKADKPNYKGKNRGK